VGAGSVVVRDVPPDSTVVGVPAHIVYQGGKRVLITDPHEVSDPLSDVIIALSDEVRRLKGRLEKLDGEFQTARLEPANAFSVEQEESALYRTEQASRVDVVSMGEGI
jgi:serine O-acetyltransferase